MGMAIALMGVGEWLFGCNVSGWGWDGCGG